MHINISAVVPVSAQANVITREACCGAGSPEQSGGYTEANVVNVKRRSCGHTQNGQPVEFGQTLFAIG